MQSLPLLQGKEIADKTARSIFVGNIPYEATEEKLIDLFSKAGPVVGFRLVYDRESGKPKGYGFCEYSDAHIASSALRNLQNIEFNGRPLRIGAAAGEQNSAEIALTNPAVGPPMENPYGLPVDPVKAPEAISQAVASLPPEQMYEIMNQMKQCIQTNPNEARTMLLQNPQLAYALLQAQVVMKLVDPKVAIAMLNRSHDQIPPLRPGNTGLVASNPELITSGVVETRNPFPPVGMNGAQFANPPSGFANDFAPESVGGGAQGMYPGFQQPPPTISGPPPPPPPQQQQQQPPPPMPPKQQQQALPLPPSGGSGFIHPSPQLPGMGGQPMTFSTNQPPPGPPPPPQTSGASQAGGRSNNKDLGLTAALMAGTGGNGKTGPCGALPKDNENLKLIMEVLSLSEEALARLPEDEQRSIRILKEQVQKRGLY